jgi:SAM-dependent methyltransferase
MGDRRKVATYIHELIVRHNPDAKSLLELACGTGAILQILGESYEIVGLDASPQMLSLARRKLPHAQLIRQSMVRFDLARKFDVIICVFDSINHVLRFSDWKKLFRRVAGHLANGGLFLFDINTLEKLQRLIRAPAWVHAFDGNLLIMDVAEGKRGLADWNVKIFEHETNNTYRLFEETFHEISFPLRQITVALRKQFKEVKIIDPARQRPSDKSDRLYFVCKR